MKLLSTNLHDWATYQGYPYHRLFLMLTTWIYKAPNRPFFLPLHRAKHSLAKRTRVAFSVKKSKKGASVEIHSLNFKSSSEKPLQISAFQPSHQFIRLAQIKNANPTLLLRTHTICSTDIDCKKFSLIGFTAYATYLLTTSNFYNRAILDTR